MLKKLYDFFCHIVNRVGATKVTEAAAAIAYYAILSFFPMILLLIALNSAFIQSVEAQTQILQWANDYLPGSQQIVMANIQHLIKASETVGYVGTIILLWSATLVFAGFAQNINMAWTTASSRHFLVDRLIGLLTISVVIIFLIIVLVTTAIIDAVPRLFPGFFTTFIVRANRFQHLIVQFMPVLTIFALLILFYKYIPNCKVLWREAIVASSFSGVAMLVTKSAFVWYITRGPNSYSLVYGSLGTVVAFMLWIYISSCIILIGGHISAAYAKFFRSPEEHAKAKDYDIENLPEFPSEK
ncbi:MAG: YihY/virulence factor BrkB family protein [Candidatus Riflebacteria bacterium]|nr:YihY/virulence factor BrkB family protein [Candidatus Riflebacteria bacterium]